MDVARDVTGYARDYVWKDETLRVNMEAECEGDITNACLSFAGTCVDGEPFHVVAGDYLVFQDSLVYALDTGENLAGSKFLVSQYTPEDFREHRLVITKRGDASSQSSAIDCPDKLWQELASDLMKVQAQYQSLRASSWSKTSIDNGNYQAMVRAWTALSLRYGTHGLVSKQDARLSLSEALTLRSGDNGSVNS